MGNYILTKSIKSSIIPDFSNVINNTNDTSLHTITLEQDAFAFMNFDHNHLTRLTIDGVSFSQGASNTSALNKASMPLKKGITISWQGASSYNFTMYIVGVK